MIYFQQSGGAIGRVPVDATAFAHRKSQANMFISLSWPLDQDPASHVAYGRAYWKTLDKSTDGWYTVDSGNEPQPVVNANYQGNFPRLLKLKRKYDPENLFRLNTNIAPG